MNGIVLVDTSVWLRRERAELLKPLHDRVAICPPVVQELLQGAYGNATRAVVAEIVRDAIMLESPVSLEAFQQAAAIFRAARIAAYTIRTPYDCLIAAIAIRHGAEVLHADRDFDYIAKVTALRARNINPSASTARS
jgi:predicted nucleic acid-binding protein